MHDDRPDPLQAPSTRNQVDVSTKTLSVSPLEGASTRSEQVYEVLVQAIISGRLPPGTRLHVDHLARQLGVSSTPVRDAVGLLEGKGLVNRYPSRGAMVRVFDRKEIQNLYEVRTALESLAVVAACHRRNQQHLEALREHHRRANAALERDDTATYQEENKALHAAIFEAADNALLADNMDAIALQTQMMIAQTIRVAGRPQFAQQEHAELIALIADRNVGAATSLMKTHILTALEDILKTYQNDHHDPHRRENSELTVLKAF